MNPNAKNKKPAKKHWTPWLGAEPSPNPSLQVDAISRTIIILAVGIIIGVATTSIGLQTMADKLDDLIIGFVTVVVVIGVVTVWIVTNKERILKGLFGTTDSDLDELKSQGIDLINNFTNKDYDEAEKNLNFIISKAMAWYVWFNFRRWILVVFQALFIGFGGLLGTILLFSQNLLIEQQTHRLDKQNELMEKQNERMDQQTYLQEADRRSALVFRMDNTWNEVDRELKNDLGRPGVRDLSPELITRIVTLCEMLRPYRYLEGGILSKGELSVERGQVLISLVNSNLDTNSLKAIYEKGNFRYSDLVGVNFRKAYLRNVSLSYASLAQALFPEANLGQADLTKSQLNQADFSQANLSQADLSESDLTKALLRDARLTGANLQEADLRQANLQNADLSFANLTNAKLSGANLQGAKLDQAIVHASWMGVLAKTSGDSIIGKTYVLENYRLDSVSTDAGVGYRLRLRRSPSAEI